MERQDSRQRWQFWIDRGGTFTDCIGLSPGGNMTTVKVLSSDRAPLLGIWQLLGLSAGASIPPCDIRMGTTLATNALLERKGTPTCLIITEGFRDLLEIGTQARADLFELDIAKPELLYQEVITVKARMDAQGAVLSRPQSDVLRKKLQALREQGIQSLAVALLHSYRNAELEEEILSVARACGFTDISISSEVSGEIGLLGRGDTTVVDAYLTPLIRRYLDELRDALPGSTLQFMQSSGGLTSASSFRGKNAVLSGPAGGVVAYGEIARQAGFDRAIGFDMGGTSTDVSCIDGELERSYESEIAGIRLRAPMLSIHTVAAGGGSICEDNGFRFTVGPHSAGSSPGPLCYQPPSGASTRGGLTITDCNLVLGRVVDDRFPFSLHRGAPERRLEEMSKGLANRGIEMSAFEIAAGFVAIANANMAAAIREVTIAKGRDLRDFVLVVFGGAGGQHSCALARQLGVRSLLIDEQSGVLSAYGMGLAELSWHGQKDAGLLSLSALADLDPSFQELERQGSAIVASAGGDNIKKVRRVDLRYRGTDSAITLECTDALAKDFEVRHQRLYGYCKESEIEVVALRVEVCSASAQRPRPAQQERPNSERPTQATLKPLRTQPVWSEGALQGVPVYGREQLEAGMQLQGPALILDPTGTIYLDRGWTATMQSERRLLLKDTQPEVAASSEKATEVDPIRLEIFNNLFMSTAVQMGEALRATAVSTNIRERLDFSCAVFDAEGGLVANAPHIPVHLGAMGETIRGVLSLHPNPSPGSVYASNDPNFGGSHLPDITVITPVHDATGTLIFFTASRGHHADVGGTTPGSMPPFSSSLAEEGVVLRAMEIVRAGVFDEGAVRKVFASGPYPARCIAENMADLKAQIAANQRGVGLLREMLESRGANTVLAYMGHVQDNAAEQVAASIRAIGEGEYHFADTMDDGARIEVCLRVHGQQLHVDFSGSGAQSEGNLNAPRAVTLAALMYVLRCLVGTKIPLNSGCLRQVELILPPNSIVNPDEGCAVAAGNVETSQRIVDVLLASLGLAAASQGTMNNLTFGNESFGYYETIAGGAGATASAPGASGVHTHMTNTRITDPEILESRFPVRLHEFSIRAASGGRGRNRGGDGLVREIEALVPLEVSIISERRSVAPFGLQGGDCGAPGRNLLNGELVPAKTSLKMEAGDRLRIETPGGGGYGPEAS
jgi:5-oxoprolinase (ATP-hydrolysing)